MVCSGFQFSVTQCFAHELKFLSPLTRSLLLTRLLCLPQDWPLIQSIRVARSLLASLLKNARLALFNNNVEIHHQTLKITRHVKYLLMSSLVYY